MPRCPDVLRRSLSYGRPGENFALVPEAIDRAATRRITDQTRRTGRRLVYSVSAATLLEEFAQRKKGYVTAQYISNRARYVRSRSSGLSDASITGDALGEFEALWANPESRLCAITGKEALGAINATLQERYGISVTPTAIIDAMRITEVPEEMRSLIGDLSEFSLTLSP